MIDRKWIEDERDGWRVIAESMSPEPVREHARMLREVLDEVLEKRGEREG